MKLWKLLFGTEELHAPAVEEPFDSPIKDWGNLDHLTPEQRVNYVYADARRVVNEARNEMAQNAVKFARLLAEANAIPIQRIKAAEASYEQVKKEAL